MSKPLTNVDIAWLMDSIRSIPQRDHRFATAQGWYEICTGAFQWKVLGKILREAVKSP